MLRFSHYKSPRHRILLITLMVLLTIGWQVYSIMSARAAITLLYFSAISGDRQVRLVWQTATELNNSGFFVHRSSQRDSGYIPINPDIIPAQGDGLTGATYEYIDANLTNGVQYWYKLESIDLGQNSEFSDPTFAIVGATATPTTVVTGTITPSTTPTATPSPTTTMTQPSGVSTATRTAAPAQSGLPTATFAISAQPLSGSPTTYPGPVQPGVTQPGDGSGQAGVPAQPGQANLAATQPANTSLLTGPTQTLIPFPTVTIIFPATDSAPLQNLGNIDDASSNKESMWRLWPLGLLLVFWLGLVALFFISRHHIG